jgi:hypothetical protein
VSPASGVFPYKTAESPYCLEWPRPPVNRLPWPDVAIETVIDRGLQSDRRQLAKAMRAAETVLVAQSASSIEIELTEAKPLCAVIAVGMTSLRGEETREATWSQATALTPSAA